MSEEASFLDIYAEMTSKEQVNHWKQEDIKDNHNIIEQLHYDIRLDEWLIQDTKDWLQGLVYKIEDTAELKKYLIVGAETIEVCEDNIKYTLAEIAHTTKYPMYSIKRRDYYRTLRRRNHG